MTRGVVKIDMQQRFVHKHLPPVIELGSLIGSICRCTFLALSWSKAPRMINLGLRTHIRQELQHDIPQTDTRVYLD